MNNICFFNSNKVWGGGEKWHYEMALHLAKKGFGVFAVTNRKSDLFYRLSKHPEIHVFSYRLGNISFLNLIKVLMIYRFYRKNKIDAVVLGLSGDVKIGGIAAALAGVKKIIYRRGTALPVKNTRLNRFLYRHVLTDVISNSEEIKRGILQNKNLVAEKQVHTIYNGIDTSLSYPPNGHEKYLNGNHTVIIGNAGRMVEQKGQQYLIQVAENLQKKNIPFKMIIAGKGELKNSLLQEVKSKNLDNQVYFTDFIEDIHSFLEQIDIFVLPSLHEGSANIVLEAMGHGKPVVAFNISSLPELVSDGKTGFLARFRDAEDLTDKITKLIEDPSLRKKAGKEGRSRVEQFFRMDDTINNFIDVIKN